MPEPKTSMGIFENRLQKAISPDNENKGIKGSVHLQCIVNCRGEAGDYQVIYCPDEMAFIEQPMLDTFRNYLNAWRPGKQREATVDVLVRIVVILNEEKIKVIAPLVFS